MPERIEIIEPGASDFPAQTVRKNAFVSENHRGEQVEPRVGEPLVADILAACVVHVFPAQAQRRLERIAPRPAAGDVGGADRLAIHEAVGAVRIVDIAAANRIAEKRIIVRRCGIEGYAALQRVFGPRGPLVVHAARPGIDGCCGALDKVRVAIHRGPVLIHTVAVRERIPGPAVVRIADIHGQPVPRGNDIEQTADACRGLVHRIRAFRPGAGQRIQHLRTAVPVVSPAVAPVGPVTPAEMQPEGVPGRDFVIEADLSADITAALFVTAETTDIGLRLKNILLGSIFHASKASASPQVGGEGDLLSPEVQVQRCSGIVHEAVLAILQAQGAFQAVGLFPDDDIDDAARTGGRIFAARHGDHLDAPDLFRRHGAQISHQGILTHVRVFAVDPDRRPALADNVEFVVSRGDDQRGVLQNRRGIRPGQPRGGTHVEDEAVGLALEERRLDNHPADGVIPGLHFDFQRSVSLDGGITVGIAEIGRFQEQRRRGVRQFQGKIPVHISHSADKQGTVGRLQQMEMRSGQGAAVGGIEHVSGDGRGLRLCGRRQQEQVQQRRKKQETDPVPPPLEIGTICS